VNALSFIGRPPPVPPASPDIPTSELYVEAPHRVMGLPEHLRETRLPEAEEIDLEDRSCPSAKAGTMANKSPSSGLVEKVL